MGGRVEDKLAFSLFRGIRRVSLIKIAQCLDPDPNLKNQKAKKREKSPKKQGLGGQGLGGQGFSSISSSPNDHSRREKDSERSSKKDSKSERKKLKRDQKDQISPRKSEKNGEADRNPSQISEISRNQDGLFHAENHGQLERLLETYDRPESPVPNYDPDSDEPGEPKNSYFKIFQRFECLIEPPVVLKFCHSRFSQPLWSLYKIHIHSALNL